jgi:hypothetical protein
MTSTIASCMSCRSSDSTFTVQSNGFVRAEPIRYGNEPIYNVQSRLVSKGHRCRAIYPLKKLQDYDSRIDLERMPNHILHRVRISRYAPPVRVFRSPLHCGNTTQYQRIRDGGCMASTGPQVASPGFMSSYGGTGSILRSGQHETTELLYHACRFQEISCVC